MPFWKKSEDPWDMEPEKTSYAVEKEEQDGSLLNELREFGREAKDMAIGLSGRVLSAVQSKEEPEGPPETCPWCGKEMERGYLIGGRGIYWAKRKPKALSLDSYEDAPAVDDEGDLLNGGYKTAWYCRDCQKMTLTLALDSPEAQSQQEYEGELHKYAEQAKQR